MNALARIDRDLFVLINQKWISRFLDAVKPVITDFDFWRIPVFAAVLAAVVRGSNTTRLALLFAVLAVAGTDLFAARVVKPWVDRDRPFRTVEGTRKLDGAHGDSFPSNHAANTWAAGTFLALRFARLRPILVVPAVISYSRVYVGVHYPFDVIAGAGLGASIGAAFAALDARLRRMRRPPPREEGA